MRTTALNTPSQRESLATFVVKRIEEALINKEIKPGDPLPPEAELSKNLNVGKSSVREALKMLQAMGVVKIKQGQGTQIRTRLDESLINPLIFQLIIENNQPREIVELRILDGSIADSEIAAEQKRRRQKRLLSQVKERYDIDYTPEAMPLVCFATVNFYDEINQPQHRGMFKFFDESFIGKPLDSD